jgi:uncharacterized protein YegL
VRCVSFSTGVRWVVDQPTPVSELSWRDLHASGYTEMGAALASVAEQMHVPPMEERALRPALVLISDGQPTDDFAAGLRRLMSEPWGAKAVRLAIAIGRDADLDVLSQFVGHPEIRPMQATNAPQLVHLIRWASTAAARVASLPAARDGTSVDDLMPPPMPPPANRVPGADAAVTW